VNDLHYIFYQPKLMYLDTSDMSCAGERAHRRAIDYTWFNDGPPLNQKRILLQITMTAEAEWPEVKRELMRKGWIEAGEYFLHRGAIKSLNESKEKYVANHNRQAKMNHKDILGLSVPDVVTGIVTIIVTLPATARVTGRQSESDKESESGKKHTPTKSLRKEGCGEKLGVGSWELEDRTSNAGGSIDQRSMAENGASRQQCPTEHIAHGAVEIPTVEEAIAMTMAVGVSESFVRYVFADWASRGGRDAGGVAVAWLPYLTKRWAREGNQWRNGTHRGQQDHQTNGKPNPRNVGMSETAADKVADLRAAISAQNGTV
jgi:hypothetical protein